MTQSADLLPKTPKTLPLRAAALAAAKAVALGGAMLALLLQAAPAGAAQKVTIMLNWLPGGAHVPIFYAKGAGHYKKAGIDAEILSTRGSRNALAALGKGEAQFAIVEASELFSQRADGIEATGVMAYFLRSPNAILTLKRADLRRLSDLAGKRIAAPRASFPRVLFPDLRGRGKIDLAKVKWLTLAPGDLLPALIGGRVDAVASSVMVAHQYREAAQEKGKKISVLSYADAGVNPYSLVLVAPNSFILKNEGLAKSFVRATAEGVAAALERPSAALRVFLKANPATAPDRVRAEWRTAHSLIYPPAARGKALGKFEKGRMKRMRKFLMRLQTFRTVPSTFGIYSNRLLPSLRPKPKSL